MQQPELQEFLYTVRRRRTVFEHSLLAVLAQESRVFGLRLLHVVREVVLVAPLAVEGPVRPLTLTAAEVNGMTSRAQGETVLVRRPAVAALLWHVFLLLEVRRHICLCRCRRRRVMRREYYCEGTEGKSPGQLEPSRSCVWSGVGKVTRRGGGR